MYSTGCVNGQVMITLNPVTTFWKLLWDSNNLWTSIR